MIGPSRTKAFEPFVPKLEPAPWLLERSANFICSLFANRTRPASGSESKFILDFNLLPRDLKVVLLSHFDLPELAQISRTSKELNAWVSADYIWVAIAKKIHCTVDRSSGVPVYKQVLSLIDRIKSALRHTRLGDTPQNMKGPLKALRIAEINHVQEWLVSRDDHGRYPDLITDLKKESEKLPDYHVRYPKVKYAWTSSAQIAQGKRLHKWVEKNKPLLQALDTLKVWREGAKAAGQAPELKDLHDEADVINRASGFIAWADQHRDQLMGLTELKLQGLRLTSIPRKIGEFINLTNLDLSSNCLTEVPEEICDLSNLSELYLSCNLIRSLPSQIGRLANLRRLYLRKNRLSSLPPEIGGLSQLAKLDASRNQLLSLSPEIAKLSLLEDLDLSSNYLTSLPPEIENCAQLKILNIAVNLFTSLPSGIGKVLNLERLNCSSNYLAELPDEFFKLPNIREIYFQNNPGGIIKSIYYELKVDKTPLTVNGIFIGTMALYILNQEAIVGAIEFLPRYYSLLE